MKKITLLSLVLVFSISLFAQRANMPQKRKIEVKENVFVNLDRYSNEADFQMASRAYGDTIYMDDFSSGTATSLPTGWTTIDVNAEGNNYVWKWNDVGATGPTTSGYEHVLASSTATNGWMILDSDNYGLGSYDTYLYSPMYDLTGQDAVAITFEELYKRWGNESSTGNPTYVGISVDSGATWTEVEIHADFESKDETDNPSFYMLNISTIAGGNYQNVQIYFRIAGLWDYWWQIDDFKIIEAAHNNLVINETYVSAAYDFGTQGVGLYGYYSQMPISQVLPMFFQADIINDGVDVQTGVTLTCDVNDGTASVFNQFADTAQLSFGDTVSLIPDLFTPTVVGEYMVSFIASQNETEEVPEDNLSQATWKVVDNKIMSRDVEFKSAISPSMYTDGAAGDLMGLNYFIPNADVVKSISVFVSSRSTVGTILIGKLLLVSDNTEIITTEEYVITEASLGQWVELDFVSDGTNDILLAETNYIAGVEFYWTGEEDNCWIGYDENGPHIAHLVTNLRLGADWFWVTNVPMIRLNLDGCTLPPTFDNPITEICSKATQDYSYSVDLLTTDPNDPALPVAITATTLPAFATLVDNGDNTATVSFDMTPSDISEFYYRFDLIADNGIAQNTATVYALVSDDFCTEDISETELSHLNIYPNPSTGIVNIENAKGSKVFVYNIVGSIVTSIDKADVVSTVDLSNFAEGTYIIKVVSNNSVVSKIINIVK